MTSKILPIRRNTRGADLTKLPTRYDARFLEELQVMKLRLSYVTHLLTCRDRPTDQLNDLMIDCFIDWLIFHFGTPLRHHKNTSQQSYPRFFYFLVGPVAQFCAYYYCLHQWNNGEIKNGREYTRKLGLTTPCSYGKVNPYVRLAEETISRKLVSSFVYLT